MKTFLSFFVFLLLFFPFSSGQTGKPVELHWLDTQAATGQVGVTWGVPWKRGALKGNPNFQLKNDSGKIVPVQSWITAYWPDGSAKWTAHASLPQGNRFLLERSFSLTPKGIKVQETDSTILIDTKLLQCTFHKKGNNVIESLKRNGVEVANQGKLVVINQDNADTDESGTIQKTSFESCIRKISVEQNGSIRSVVKVEGIHKSKTGKELLPFIVRLYFYENSEAVKIIHTLIYDADEQKDFIKGIGLRLNVPLKEEFQNRHVRFVGEKGGVFAESVRTLTGLRCDPGKAVREAQVAGLLTPPVDSLPSQFKTFLPLIPAFGDYSLSQLNDQSFSIEKRTADGRAWLASATGTRSAGTGYLGTPKGGLAFGIRNFWQSYPAQLDIRNAASDVAQVTLWLWSPQAPAMDLRFYHDGLGQDTFKKQREGLEITYEDYEPQFGTPYGVARTSELSLWALEKTPSNEELAEISNTIQQPPLLVASPEYILEQGVFGGSWSLPDFSTPQTKKIEEQLAWNIGYYRKQIDEHRWYGFWNYGDFMHTYDTDRHVWRYDVGGYAWDNSELSTDLWLWYSFLRTGDASTFRIAEAMTRHTGEVDVYHIGKFAPLGSRHNVMHWGCSAKQLRISTAINRRFLYYLTADERIGDLMQEQVDAVERLHEVVPYRKLDSYTPESRPRNQVLCSFGTDWGAVAAAWFTQWERTSDPKILTKLTNSMKTIAAQPRQFYTGSAYMDTNTGKFELNKSNQVVVSHLNAVFGLTEICSELIQNLDVLPFKKAWLDYCRLYNASAEEQKKELGEVLELNKMTREHSRITAYAAHILNDKNLGQRAWKEFLSRKGGNIDLNETKVIYPPLVLYPVTENASVSTNAVAQWSLAAIQNLAWAKQWIGNKKFTPNEK